MTELADLKPDRAKLRTSDATHSGSHFLKDFAMCPTRGARNHFYAHPDLLEDDPTQTVGLAPFYTKEAFLRGSALHDGLEEWYRSRVRDGEDTGEADLDRAIAAADTSWANRLSELVDQDGAEKLVSATRLLLQRYHDYYGPKGPLQEWPETKIFITDGKPWIEETFEIDLGHGFVYTCRTDLLVVHRGFVSVMDHKSSKASFVKRLGAMAHLEAQFTGELLCLHHEHPEVDVGNIIINVLVKDRAKGPPFDRFMTDRSPEALRLYALHTRDLFRRIAEWKDRYEYRLSCGDDPEESFAETWPQDGLRHGACYAYFQRCEYWDLCKNPGLAAQLIPTTFKPRRRIADELEEEN